MVKLNYFDCNCSIGRVPRPRLLDISNVEGLLSEMDNAGVEEALVFHTMARDTDPPLGNKLLHEEIDNEARLHPAWVVMPHYTGEIPPPQELLKEMERKGVKAVQMYPTKAFHSFSLAEWSSGELLSALEEARVPLMLDIEIVWWDAIHTILKNHPQLPVIAMNLSYRHNRYVYPLFEKFENLYIDTSRNFGPGNFEDGVKRYGAGHFLFGTNMPQYAGGGAVSMLTYAEISQEDKQAIAGDNLRNILKGALS